MITTWDDDAGTLLHEEHQLIPHSLLDHINVWNFSAFSLPTVSTHEWKANGMRQRIKVYLYKSCLFFIRCTSCRIQIMSHHRIMISYASWSYRMCENVTWDFYDSFIVFLLQHRVYNCWIIKTSFFRYFYDEFFLLENKQFTLPCNILKDNIEFLLIQRITEGDESFIKRKDELSLQWNNELIDKCWQPWVKHQNEFIPLEVGENVDETPQRVSCNFPPFPPSRITSLRSL